MISKELSLAALEKWGLERQTNMCIEEIGEFLQAWNKMRRGAITESQYVEEMADVYIMFSQMRHIYGKKFEKVLENKLKRTKDKINGTLEYNDSPCQEPDYSVKAPDIEWTSDDIDLYEGC